MAEVLLFHHAQGQTAGFHAFADELRRADHTVHTPDLYDGRTFDTLDEGIAHAREIGFMDLLERGVRTADELPHELVYGGFSLGVMPAQKLAQTRPGARGALLFYFCPACLGEKPVAVTVAVEYKGTAVHLCGCPGCTNRFRADPELLLARLAA